MRTSRNGAVLPGFPHPARPSPCSIVQQGRRASPAQRVPARKPLHKQAGPNDRRQTPTARSPPRPRAITTVSTTFDDALRWVRGQAAIAVCQRRFLRSFRARVLSTVHIAPARPDVPGTGEPDRRLDPQRRGVSHSSLGPRVRDLCRGRRSARAGSHASRKKHSSSRESARRAR